MPVAAASSAAHRLSRDPLVEQHKLIGDAAGDGFGPVALSPDGNTALIAGAVGLRVYTRSGGNWSKQQTFPLSGGASSVALSADGKTALVGQAGSNNGVGAAWVFTRSGNGWSERQQLTAPTSGSDAEIGSGGFGYSVALSGDGGTALIGAQLDNNGVGAAWVFTRSASGWSEQQKLTAPTNSRAAEIGGGWFGFTVTLSREGSSALIGGRYDNGGVGAVWAFGRSGARWSEQQKLVAPSSGPDAEIRTGWFGASVALASNGKTLLIGGSEDGSDPSAEGPGAVWVFTRSSRGWSEEQKITAPSGGGDAEIGPANLGMSISLSSDGRTALIGGAGDVGAAEEYPAVGAAWLFTRAGSRWSERQKLIAPTAGPDAETASGWFGYIDAVALSANGTTALIGGPNDNYGVGAVWIFGGARPKPSTLKR